MKTRGEKALMVTELIGTIMVLLGLYRVYSLFNSNGYLPPPFVFDVGDTFMDWFHTAFWAHNGAAYSFWRTIYLPLSFAITGFFGNPRCYANAQYDARDCDWIGYIAILAMYIGCIVVTAIALWRRDRSSAVYRTICIALGGPMLFALERGNLIMLAYIPFVMVYGGVVRSVGWVAATSAFLANMKVYMIFPVFAIAIRRDWRLVEMCAIASVALYLITLFIVGEGTIFEMIDNLQNWFSVRLGAIWDELLYTTTYKPFLQLDIGQYPVRDYIYEEYIEAGKIFVETYVLASRGVCLFIIALSWLYPRALSVNRLIFFILMQSFISQNPGGYSIALIVFLVFMERGRNFAIVLSIICCYLMSVPGDISVTKIFDVERESWLSGKVVISEYVLPLGALVRPGIIAIMLWALAIDSLIDLHRAIRSGPPNWGLLERFRGGKPVAPPLAPSEATP